jgi:hypothetical protein
LDANQFFGKVADVRPAFAFEELEPKVMCLAETGMTCPTHQTKLPRLGKFLFRNQPAKILLSKLRNG